MPLRRWWNYGIGAGVVSLLMGAFLAASALAAGSVLPDIGSGGELREGLGQADLKTPLQRDVTYQASAFPLALRVRAPDDKWAGVQVQSGRFRFVQLLHLRTGNVPLHGMGFVTIESAKGTTPSVATAVKRLQDTPNITSGPVKAVRLAGFRGLQFDATITGSDFDASAICADGRKCSPQVSLAPFLPNPHCGFCGDAKLDPRVTHDVKVAIPGQLFRFIVISVRHKTVVIYLEPFYGPNKGRFTFAKTFPTFLPYARKLVAALRFSA